MNKSINHYLFLSDNNTELITKFGSYDTEHQTSHLYASHMAQAN